MTSWTLRLGILIKGIQGDPRGSTNGDNSNEHILLSRNFFIHLRFIFTVFKHKYLKIGDTHEAQHTFKMFCYQERSFDRKDKVSSFILPEILVKNDGINKITRKN